MNANNDNSLEQLQNPAVRDLAWACFSTPLLRSEELADQGQNVSNCGLGLNFQRRRWLEGLDREPQPLLDHLGSLRSNRLGIYFEHLWHFFLQQDEHTHLLAHNLAVRDHERTVGEFDCIYFCQQRQRHFHLELAVKFFLGVPQDGYTMQHSHWNQWLGPNTRDRLDLKIERLMQHQIRLADQPAAQEVLQNLGVATLEREVEIKGRLFRPGNGAIAIPYACTNPQLPQTWWAIEELPTQQWANNLNFLLLQRGQWFAGVAPRTDLHPVGKAKLLQLLQRELATTGRPQLVAAVDSEGFEVERFFVTRQGWPGDA